MQCHNKEHEKEKYVHVHLCLNLIRATTNFKSHVNGTEIVIITETFLVFWTVREVNYTLYELENKHCYFLIIE